MPPHVTIINNSEFARRPKRRKEIVLSHGAFLLISHTMTTNKNPEEAEGKMEGAMDAPIKVMSQAEFTDQLTSHQSLLQAKNAELTRLTEMLRSAREAKIPLAKVKNTLQEEIIQANKAINAKTEEVTLLKQKLRYHSLKQITDNIERLEYQLRNNNYKPREEQKILDEISMLQRSTKTLKEYETKQAENKKYRAERTRLIDERNNNYSKIRALYAQEDEIRKEISAVRGVIATAKKSIEQLKQMRPALEQVWQAQRQQQVAARQKRQEGKRRMRQEQNRERQEERRKLWEEYEASREPYEEERDTCRVLISYLQSSVSAATPSTPGSSLTPLSPETPVLTPSTPGRSFSTAVESPVSNVAGSFYSKPKDDDGFVRVSKRDKAKAKRELRLANRVKELPHTPDVLTKFAKLSIAPPKTTDEVAATIITLQDCLQHFNILSLSKVNQASASTGDNTSNIKCERPTSLSIRGSGKCTDIPESTSKHSSSNPERASTSSSITPKHFNELSPVIPKHLSSPSPTMPPNIVKSQVASSSSVQLSRPVVTLNASNTPPVISWAAALATKKYVSEPSSTLDQTPCKEPEQQPLYNGIHSPINPSVAHNLMPYGIIPSISKPIENKVCNDIVSPVNLNNVCNDLVSPGMVLPRNSLPVCNSMIAPINSSCNDLVSQGIVLSRSPVCNDLVSPMSSACSDLVTQRMVSSRNSTCNDLVSPRNNACSDLVSPRNNESFFSVPLSYPGNLVEVNNNEERSYASVAAKTRAATVEY